MKMRFGQHEVEEKKIKQNMLTNKGGEKMKRRKRTTRKVRRKGKRGWFGEPLRHHYAALKALRTKGLKPKRYRMTKRGLALDRKKKSKHIRYPWQPAWRGDLPGKMI